MILRFSVVDLCCCFVSYNLSYLHNLKSIQSARMSEKKKPIFCRLSFELLCHWHRFLSNVKQESNEKRFNVQNDLHNLTKVILSS